MRLLSYFILAYVSMGLQVGLAGVLRYQGAGINFVLLAVIFISLNAPREPALLGSFVLGALQDLATQQPLGLHALAYGLIAMFLVAIQNSVKHEHPATHFSLALVTGLMSAGIILLADASAAPFASAFYTALLAPFVLGGLTRLRRLFAFQPPRRKIRI
jgi:rod shape-determining protein MreD